MQKLTFPVGRIVQGSLYARQPVKDDKTKQTLPDKATGQPRTRCYFAVAIPKGVEPHWNLTPWGQVVWAEGMASDNLADRKRDFSWKVSDGDSTDIDLKNNRPCDKEGFPGHWIVRFSTEQSNPKLYSSVSGKVVEAVEKDEILPGYWVEVRGSVKFNGSQKPGLYCNPEMVCLRATDARIVSSAGESVEEAGFGAAPLPAGVTPRPTGSVMPPIPAAAAPTAVVVPPPAAVVVPPLAPAFRMPPPVPVAAPVRTMLPAAQGATYEQCIAAGWTDALLIDNGMMVA